VIGFIERIGEAIESAAEDFGDSGDRDGLLHIVCSCSPNHSLCGRNGLTGEDSPVELEEPDDCLVCVDLNALKCPRCGMGGAK
jgi:hypothetical protein